MQQLERREPPGATGVDDRWLLLLATLAVFAIYAWSTWSRTVPLVAQDELGFISQSQLLAGVPAINMGSAPYYHFGYALLLVPVWWITHDPLLAYKGFMLVNTVLAALQVPLLVAVGTAFGFRRSPPLILAAAIIALWPSGFFVSHYAWSDALFRVLFAAHILALMHAVSRRGVIWPLLFAATAALLYAVHPKALLILLLAPLLLVALGAARAVGTRTLVAALLVFAVLTGAIMLALDHLHGALWNAGAYSAGKMLLARLLRPEALPIGLTEVLGQLWYQLAASLGLAALGIWFMVRRIIHSEGAVPRLVAGYLLAAVLAVAIASVVQMLDPTRVDHLAYGRYIDGASMVLVWLGLCWLLFGARGEGQRGAGLVAIVFVLAAGGLLAVLPLTATLQSAIPDNVGGIGWIFRGNSTPAQLFWINSLFLAIMAMLLLFISRSAQLVLLVLFVSASSAMIHRHEEQHAEIQLYELSADAAVVGQTGLAPLFWSDGVRDRSFWAYHLQYVLATSFADFGGPLPPGAGVISEASTGDGLACAARLSHDLYVLANPAEAGSGC